MASANSVEVTVRSPTASTTDLRMKIGLNDTVGEIKQRCSASTRTSPRPGEQRLIFAGDVLAAGQRTADVLLQYDVSRPQTFHLMTSPSKAASPQRMQSAPAGLGAERGGGSAAASAPRRRAPPPPPRRRPAAAAAAAAAVAAPPARPAAVRAPRRRLSRTRRRRRAGGGGGDPAVWRGDRAVWRRACRVVRRARLYQQLVMTGGGGMPYVFAVPLLPLHAPPLLPGAAGPPPALPAAAATPAVAAAAAVPQPAAAGGGGAAAADDDGDGMGGEEGDEPISALKLLVKLAVFVFILGQDGGSQRLLLLCSIAVAIFLAQTGRLDFLAQIELNYRVLPPPPHPAAAAAATPTPPPPPTPPPTPPRRRRRPPTMARRRRPPTTAPTPPPPVRRPPRRRRGRRSRCCRAWVTLRSPSCCRCSPASVPVAPTRTAGCRRSKGPRSPPARARCEAAGTRPRG